MSDLMTGTIGSMIARRSEESIRFAAAMRLIEFDQANVREQMLNSAPEAMRDWLDDTVIDTVMRSGRYIFKMPTRTSRFGDFNDIDTKMKALALAWGGAVEITVTDREDGRVDVSFKATF